MILFYSILSGGAGLGNFFGGKVGWVGYVWIHTVDLYCDMDMDVDMDLDLDLELDLMYTCMYVL